MTRIETHSEAETERAGQDLAGSLQPGDVVLLTGDLGAGKTVFVRGLAAGLGADPRDVSSPTFTLIQEYRGRVPLYHVDLYRLGRGEAAELGLEEIAGEGGVLAIEWPDRLEQSFDAVVRVEIADAGGENRIVTVRRDATRRDSSALPS